MKQFEVCLLSELKTSKKIVKIIEGVSILIIDNDKNIFAIENKCGHFGIPLNDAIVNGDTIKCLQHGIIFDLNSGININRPWEECDILRRFPLSIKNKKIFVSI